MSQNRLPGIANPQNTKGLGHFLTTDCKSVETPNGKKPPMHHAPGAQKSFNYVSYHYMKTVVFQITAVCNSLAIVLLSVDSFHQFTWCKYLHL